jgi:hypothetical protein
MEENSTYINQKACSGENITKVLLGCALVIHYDQVHFTRQTRLINTCSKVAHKPM